MFKKLVKAAIGFAFVSTGIGFITKEVTKAAFLSTLGKRFVSNFLLIGLSYVTAKGSEDTPAKNIGFKAATRNPIAPRNIVYGKTRVGGTIVYQKTSGANNVKLHNVIALAGHEIEDITKMYIDAGKGMQELSIASDFAETSSGSGIFIVSNSAFVDSTNSDKYNTAGGLIKIIFEKGSQTAVNSAVQTEINDSGGSDWTTNHKLEGIAYIYVGCVYDTGKFAAFPTFSFEVKGKKVVDPRVHATNTTFSTNPALIIRDYLKDTVYGCAASSDEINDDTTGAGFKKAASDCDDSIAVTGGNESRFTLNGQFDSTAEPQSILENMLSACAGQLGYNNGKFNLFVGKARTASGTITDDKLLAPLQVTIKQSGFDRYNGVKATFQREDADDYKAAEITPVKNTTFLNADTPDEETAPSFEKFMNVAFPLTTSKYTAQRLAEIALKYSRQEVTTSVLVPLEFLAYQVGDIVNLDNARVGYTGKDFEITGINFEFLEDNYLALRLDLKEYSSSVFDNVTYNDIR